VSTVQNRPSPSAGEPEKTALPSYLLHDLRSPLNQIIGYSEILLEDAAGQQPAEFGKDVQNIHTAGQRILALLEENFTTLPDSSPDEPNAAPVASRRRITDAFTAQPSTTIQSRPAHVPGLLLVVDDDAANRDVLSRRLNRQGHDVRTASNGSDALALMSDTAFDAVLLDIMMPDMDGYEVLRRMKADARLQHIPVIMISALSELQSVVRCIEAGAEDYLTKPFDPTLLKARIGASLEKKWGRDRETALFEQLQENYKRLEEAEKLRDDLRNMIVHDLRTPLTAVIGGVEMLGQAGSLTEMQREMAGIAINGGKTLLGMINDLLDVEKMEAGLTRLNYSEVTAAALIAGAIAQVAVLADIGQTALVPQIAQGLPAFSADESQLSRTLVNLIANAIKLTPAGTVTITAQTAGENIRFAVRDSGRGIPPEAFERIFEKFGQVESHNRIGTGLGLTFCKLAVEAHGGHIEVESTPDVGSTFSFTIPINGNHASGSLPKAAQDM
jgi:two-component system, sensor histidine kinase and response regulator